MREYVTYVTSSLVDLGLTCYDLRHCRTWWHHEMENFPRYWPFVQGIHWSPVNSPHKGQWRRALVFSLIFAWTNGWVNNRDAGDLRHHCTHYDVTVMKQAQNMVLSNGRRYNTYIDGLVQEKRNSSALAMELRLSCTNPLIYFLIGRDLVQTLIESSLQGAIQNVISSYLPRR